MAEQKNSKWKFVKPKDPKGLVRNPDAGYTPLPATGSWVSRTPYWMARLDDESVIEATPPKAKTKSQPEE